MALGHVARSVVALVCWTLAFSVQAARTLPAVEYYNSTLDHYFITASDIEITALDSGRFTGWKRTGESFETLDSAISGAVPVCRIYLPPGNGDSHFYSASASECSDAVARYPALVLESASVMYAALPNADTGACGAEWTPIYRMWNKRADGNHRYTTNPAVRTAMIAKGYIAEGYGPDSVTMCAPPPSITAASPTFTLGASATQVSVPGIVSLEASSPITSARVQKVDFYADSKLIGSKTSSPYTLAYNVAQAGSFTFSAIATDGTGARGYSNTVNVTGVAPLAAAPGPTVSIMVTQAAPDTFAFGSTAVAVAPATIASYAWDFGDGTTASTATISHTYTKSGTYTVTLTVRDSKNAAGTATKTVTATVATTTPPPPPPSTSTAWVDRVQSSIEATNWLQASSKLHSNWVSPGGDWFDKNGVFNGPTPIISQVVTATTMTLDISAVGGDLLLQGVRGWNSATIDGVAATGFWTDPTSNRAQALPVNYGRPSFMLNPTKGKTLVIVLPPSAVGQTLRIDRVAGPAIPSLPMNAAGASTPDIKSLDPVSEAAVVAATGAGNVAQPWAYDTSVGNINGLPYLRFAITPANQRGISWFLKHTPMTEVYGRYCIYIEDDVALGMTELGVKLPGLSGDEVSWRMEHGAIAPRNPNVYAAVDYRYAADTGSGYGQINTGFNQMFRAGRWYVIEQYAKNNTFTNSVANSDGLGKVWINGNLVWNSSTVKWNNSPAARFTFLHVNVYHGGMGLPTQNIHYRIAGIAVSSKYIGPPPQLANYVPPTGSTTEPPPTTTTPPPTTTTPPPTSTPPVVAPPPSGAPSPNPTSYPAWRQPLPVGTFSTIANTANMNGTTANTGTINAWNGFAASDNTWFSALNGGHADSWENKVIKFDFSQAAPKWTLVNNGSNAPGAANALYYPDGLPASRHTYYTAQYVKTRNRLIMMGSPAVWGTGSAGGPNVDGFDLAANRWDAAGSWPSIPFASGTVGAVAKHPQTEDIYYGNNGKFGRWIMTTGLWETFSVPGNPQWMFKPTLIDVARNRWVEAAGQTLYFIDLATKQYTSRAITGMGSNQIGDYAGMTHDLDNDRYVVNAAGVIFTVDPASGAAQQIAILPVPVNGSSSRFTYFKDLGGIAYLPTFASNVYFMPTR